MKLFRLHEEEAPFEELVVSKVHRKIMDGDSRLRELLRGSGFTLQHVQYAIENGECLSSNKPGSKALGPTYLEQTVSNILRDLVTGNELPIAQLNDARKVFGLDVLSPRLLKREKKRARQNRYGRVEGGQVKSPPS